MAVRLNLVIATKIVRRRHGRATRKRLDTVAVLNGGFETTHPTVLMPASALSRILRTPIADARPVAAEVAGGEAAFLRLQEQLEVWVQTPDRTGPSTWCRVLVSENDREVLVSDTGIDALDIEIVSFGRGLWRFHGERQERPSEAPQYW